MKQKFSLIVATALIIIVFDHLTKWLIVAYLPLGGEIPVLGGFFDIVHTRNTGAAFGVLSGWNSPYRDTFFYVIAMVAFAFILHYIRITPANDRISLVSLALIAGGAFGNIIDRLARGSVVDFLSVHYHDVVWDFTLAGSNYNIPLIWPAFNVADAAICVGVALLLWRSVQPYRAT